VFVGGNSEAYQQADWPMTNLRAKEAERAAAIFQQRKMQPDMGEGDDQFFDAKEYHTSNKQIANILSQTTGGDASSKNA
jgi:hypothetical protein